MMESMMATGLVVFAAFTAAVLMVMIVVSAIATTRRVARKYRPAEDEIRRRVERRYQQRMVFAFHAVMFVFGNAAYWLASQSGDQWRILVTTLWAALLCIHGVGLYFSEAKERAVQREIEHQWTMSSAEKPKRDRLVLSDDGELVEMAWDSEQPQRQSGSYDD